MILFTDGRATAGDVADAGLALAAAGVKVFVEPMAPRDIGDTWIDAVSLPARLAAGEDQPGEVRARDQQDAAADRHQDEQHRTQHADAAVR